MAKSTDDPFDSINPNPSRLSEAVDELQKFWRMGRASLDRTAAFPMDGSVKTAEAAKRKVNPETLRQARVFARRCPEKELNKRIQEAIRAGWPPYPTSMVAVYNVIRRRDRERLWKETLAGRYSSGQILAALRAQNLPRAKHHVAGRKVQVPKDPRAAQQRLLELTRHWISAVQATLTTVRLTPTAERLLKRNVGVMRKLAAALELKRTSRAGSAKRAG